MKNHIKVIVALLGVVALGLSSCGTINGIGQDVRRGGAALSNAASR